MMLNDSALEAASESAVKYSKASNMSDLNKIFTPSSHVSYNAPLPPPYMPAFPPSMLSAMSMAHPMPMAATASRSAVEGDTYSIAKQDISYYQSERFVSIY